MNLGAINLYIYIYIYEHRLSRKMCVAKTEEVTRHCTIGTNIIKGANQGYVYW